MFPYFPVCSICPRILPYVPCTLVYPFNQTPPPLTFFLPTQVGMQTNEDSLSQETQTESPLKLDKWTQKPISVNVGPDMKSPPTPQDYLGVGGDMPPQEGGSEDSFGASAAGDVGRLTKFLSAASQVSWWCVSWG